MFGDICNVCETPVETCSCTTTVTGPCYPEDTGECSSWMPMSCVFWMGDEIAGTPIKKGVRLTEVVVYLLNRIKEAEAGIGA